MVGVSRVRGDGGSAEPVQVPVVEALLTAARGLGCVPFFRFFDEGLRLAALDALGQILLASVGRVLFGVGDTGRESGGAAQSCAGLLEACKPVSKFARGGAGSDQAAPAALALDGGDESVLELAERGQSGLQGELALLFFKVENAQEAPQGARDGHGLDLGCQRCQTAQTVGQTRGLKGSLGEKGAHGLAGAQGAVEIWVRARLVGADADQVF